ncbi:hypothetical protein OPV22_018912 [Ensete ventricosum]|uniref:Charged multivesicular body protein 4b n=1 Tax=Ensete ventricosum TaxID=4639 RepID=A0AAV8R1C2_ENSVE|nr:hypothetical protein OPV22_018912 [Ensete ventricosum]
MFSRLFGKPKEKADNLSTMDKLYEEQALMKKVAAEIQKAKEFTKANNKRAAIQCLKRKRLYKQQVKQLGNFQLRIHDQQTENMKQIQEALSLGVAVDFDEDELEAELEDLEGAELEGELLKPVTAAPAPPVQNPSVRLPTQPMPQKSTSEDDELAAVQSEMAM